MQFRVISILAMALVSTSMVLSTPVALSSGSTLKARGHESQQEWDTSFCPCPNVQEIDSQSGGFGTAWENYCNDPSEETQTDLCELVPSLSDALSDLLSGLGLDLGGLLTSLLGSCQSAGFSGSETVLDNLGSLLESLGLGDLLGGILQGGRK